MPTARPARPLAGLLLLAGGSVGVAAGAAGWGAVEQASELIETEAALLATDIERARVAVGAARASYDRAVGATYDVAHAIGAVPQVASTAASAIDRAVAAGRSGASAAVQVARQLETAQGRYGRAISGSFSLGSASSGLRGAAGTIQVGLDTLPGLAAALSDAAVTAETAAMSLYGVADSAPAPGVVFGPVEGRLARARAVLAERPWTPILMFLRLAALGLALGGAGSALLGWSLWTAARAGAPRSARA